MARLSGIFILDEQAFAGIVTDPEPPVADSPLYSLDNVMLTPHIAGALGGECRRLGRMMVEELDRYLHAAPLLGEVRREQVALLAGHDPAYLGAYADPGNQATQEGSEDPRLTLGVDPLHPVFAAERSAVVSLAEALNLVDRLGSPRLAW